VWSWRERASGALSRDFQVSIKRDGSLTLDRKDYLNAYGKALVLWMSTSRAKAEPDVCSLMKYCENKKHHASIRYTVSL
jgi:hypothetical protein